MGEWLGRDIDITLTGMAHGGVAVGRYDGRVVFVGDALPGETVAATVTDDSKSSFWRADATSVVEASPHRVPHVWAEAAIERPLGSRVGGADFGHIALTHQRELKREILRDALVRFGKLDDPTVSLLLGRVEPVAGDDEANGLGWRTRVRLHVDESGRIGPRAHRSHRVISVESLPLATDGVNSVAPLRENYGASEVVDVLDPTVGDPRLIIGHQTPTVIRERVGEREFRLDDSGFWQVHRGAAELLTATVRDLVDDALFNPTAYNLDLYGGVGLFAAALAELGGTATRITSVEANERATEHAGENLAEWVGAFSETGKVEKWLPALERRATPAEQQRLRDATVVLDPPRAGAGREVMATLGRLAPAQIVYVACDPVALSRDIAFAAGAGYRPTRMRAFDLFPHTHHLETVCLLVRD